MDGTSPLLEVLAASELPVPAQRALAERAPHLAARVPNLDPGLRRTLLELVDPFDAPGRMGLMWADLLDRTPPDELGEVIASLAVAPDGPVSATRMAPFHDLLARCRLSARQLAEAGAACCTANAGRFGTQLAETVVAHLSLPAEVARHWVPMMSTENRFRFVLDHPSADPDLDAAALVPELVRSAGVRTLWLAALLGRFRPRAAAAAARRVAVDEPDASGGRGAQMAAAQLSLLCTLGHWDDVTVAAAAERASEARRCGHGWFRAQRLLCDPTVPEPVAAAVVEHCGVVDVWSPPARSMGRAELAPSVRAAMGMFAAPPQREWHVLAAWMEDCEDLVEVFEAAADGHGAEFDAQLADTVAVAEGRRIGLVGEAKGAADTWKALALARDAAQRHGPPPAAAAEEVALLVEACGASEVAWRTAVAFAQDQATLGFGELAALVEVACAPPVEK